MAGMNEWMRRAHTRKLGAQTNVPSKMGLHIFHTRRFKYRWVLVKCCTNEILCTHRLWKIRVNIGPRFESGSDFFQRTHRRGNHSLHDSHTIKDLCNCGTWQSDGTTRLSKPHVVAKRNWFWHLPVSIGVCDRRSGARTRRKSENVCYKMNRFIIIVHNCLRSGGMLFSWSGMLYIAAINELDLFALRWLSYNTFRLTL